MGDLAEVRVGLDGEVEVAFELVGGAGVPQPLDYLLSETAGRFGRLRVRPSSPEDALADGAGTAQGLSRQLVLADGVPEGVLHITARAAACDGEKGQPIPDHAACHLYQQDWGIPFALDADGESELVLDLRGVN